MADVHPGPAVPPCMGQAAGVCMCLASASGMAAGRGAQAMNRFSVHHGSSCEPGLPAMPQLGLPCLPHLAQGKCFFLSLFCVAGYHLMLRAAAVAAAAAAECKLPGCVLYVMVDIVASFICGRLPPPSWPWRSHSCCSSLEPCSGGPGRPWRWRTT